MQPNLVKPYTSKTTLFSVCILLCIFLFLNRLQAQTAFLLNYNYEKIVTKSPEAAALETFGQLPVGTATGIPDISVPIEVIKLDDRLSLPISINYQASGYKIGEHSGLLGLKWSLNAGGSVDRDINGMPDEEYYYANYNTLGATLQTMREEYTQLGQYMLQYFLRNTLDLNQDNYSFSLPGHGGNILYSKGKFRAELNYKKYNIEATRLPLAPGRFTITDDYGNKFYCGAMPEDESGVYDVSESSVTSVPGSADPDNLAPVGGITSWKLRKMESNTGRAITIEYLPAVGFGGSSMRTSDAHITAKQDGTQGDDCPCTGSTFVSSYAGRVNWVRFISKIISPDKIIEFEYSSEASQSNAEGAVLKRIVVKNKAGEVLKTVRFFLSSYSATSSPGMLLDSVSIATANLTDSLVYKFQYNRPQLVSDISMSRDMFGFYNMGNNENLISTNDPLLPYRADRTPYLLGAAVGVLTRITYPTGGSTTFPYRGRC